MSSHAESSSRPLLFLSHASVDSQRVREIKDRLESLGFDCWLDEVEILPGDSIVERINDGLTRATFLIFFMSRASIASAWTQLEVQSAIVSQLRSNRIRLLPVLLDAIDPPPLLAGIRWADLSGTDIASGMDALSRAIRSRLEAGEDIHDDERLATKFGSAFLRLPRPQPRSGLHFFILSGPSSSGKDTLLHEVEFSLGARIEVLRKYTTRTKRAWEEDYSHPISPALFSKKLDAGDIIFPFRKRRARYGFDSEHFFSLIREGLCVIAVMTDFTLVPLLVDSMNARGIPTTAFFIESPSDALERRTIRRGFPPDEAVGRARSISEDRLEASLRPSFRDEYIFINNKERGQGLGDAADQLVTQIRKALDDRSMGQLP